MTKFQDCLARSCTVATSDTLPRLTHAWPLNPCESLPPERRQKRRTGLRTWSKVFPDTIQHNLMLIKRLRWNYWVGPATGQVAHYEQHQTESSVWQILIVRIPFSEKTPRKGEVCPFKADWRCKAYDKLWSLKLESRHLTRCCESGVGEKMANCLHTLLCKVWLFASFLAWKWCCTRVSCVDTTCLLQYKMHYSWFLASPNGLVPARHNPLNRSVMVRNDLSDCHFGSRLMYSALSTGGLQELNSSYH